MVATCNLHLHSRNHGVQTKINKCIFSKECRGVLYESFPVGSDFTNNLPCKTATAPLIWFILEKFGLANFNAPFVNGNQIKWNEKEISFELVRNPEGVLCRFISLYSTTYDETWTVL